MKKTRKIIAILLTVLTLMSVISAATPVLATEVTEISEIESAEESVVTNESLSETETSEKTETGTDESVSEEPNITQTQEAEILYEDISRRDEHTKHFVMSNGLNKAVKYAQPIHYKQNNEWVDIDNTLEYNQETDKYENKANSFKVKFDKKIDSEELFSIDNKGYTMSWKYNNNSMRSSALGKVEKLSNKNEDSDKHKPKANGKIKYNKFESACNLEYVVTGTGVKENIILDSYTGRNKFSFEVKAKDLEFIKNEDKSISVVNQSGEEIFYIPAPFMFDADNNYSYNVDYSIESKKNKSIITIIADKDWLEDKERKYPVTIDPIIETAKTKKAIDTTFVASGKPDENFDDMSDVYIGVESSNYKKCRTLVKFDLPELNSGDMVIGATLGMWLYKTSFYVTPMPDKQINAHTVTSSWNAETVTWNNKPTFNGNIVDYNFIKQSDVSGSIYEKVFDVTRTVKEWYEGTSNNYGIMIKADVEDGSNSEVAARGIFWSDKYNDNEDLYPYIEITYRNNKGLEGYWSYSSFGVGVAGTAHINDYTGNLVYELPLASSSGEIMPVDIVAYYNNYCAKKLVSDTVTENVRTSIGRGFRLNYQQTVLPSTEYGLTGDKAETYPYVYTDGDGTEHYIQKVTEDGKTVYKDEDGLGLTLVTDRDENQKIFYKITDKAHNTYYFNFRGNLSRIKDKNGNQMQIIYKAADTKSDLLDRSRIDKIIDGAGHTYTFTYAVKSSGVETDYVKTIKDDAGRVVDFDISEGLLTEVEYPGENFASFDYAISENNTSEGRINAVYSNYIYELNFDYTSVKTVKEYSETGSKGQVITFDRSKYNTTIMRSCGIDGIHYIDDNTKDDDDIITTIQFDNMGRAISQQMKFGSGDEIGAGSCAYTTSGSDDSASGFKNKVSGGGATGKYVGNLLYGGNGENLDDWSFIKKGGINAETSLSSTSKYIGEKSLKITVNGVTKNEDRCYLRQSVTNFTPGEAYTLSAYVKTGDLVPVFESDLTGAYIAIIAYNSNDDAIAEAISQPITQKTSIDVNKGWRRLSANIEIPQNASYLRCFLGVKNTEGAVGFDGIQLEKDSSVNDYNMLENTNFTNVNGNAPISWSKTGDLEFSTGTPVTNGVVVAENAVGNNTYVMKITGEPNALNAIVQTVEVEDNEDDTYILSGWAKANAVNTTFHTELSKGQDTQTTDDDEYSEAALFEIGVRVNYRLSDGTTDHEYKPSAKFNTTITDWQCASVPISLKYTGEKNGKTYTPTSIRIILKYKNQENYAFFDKIMLVKDGASSYTYDDDGNILTASSNSEQESTMKYDEYNNLTSYKDTAGNETKLTYDENHNLQTQKSAKGVKTEYTYEDNGLHRSTEIHNNWLSIDSDDNNYVAPTAAIKIEQTYFDDNASTPINEGAFIKASYDENKNATRYTYDYKTGKVLTITDPEGVVTTNTYWNDYSKLDATTIKNTRVKYVYDIAGRISDIKFGKYANGKFDSNLYEAYFFEYDKFGNVEQTFVGSYPLSTNTYKANNGPLETTEYGNGDSRRYSYNNLGQKIVDYVTDGNTEKKSYSWAYNDSGVNIRHTDYINGLQYLLDYDSLGRLSKVETVDKDTKAFIGSTEYGYDVRNNLTNLITNYGGNALEQQYFYSTVTENSNSADYAKDNLPTMYKLYDDRYAVYSYDSLNRLNQRKFKLKDTAALYYNYIYKSSDRNAEGESLYRTTQVSKEFIGNDVYVYGYDVLGNITSIKTATRKSTDPSNADFKNFTNQKSYASYSYDDLGQLTQEINSPADTKTVWTYDELGNITAKNEYTNSTGALNKTVTYNYNKDSNAGWNNILVSVDIDGNNQIKNDEEIEYDAIGNPTKYLGATLKWNGRQLTKYTKDNTTITYEYDADGLRTYKKVGGVTSKYFYANGKLHYEEKSNGTKLYFFYDSNGYLSGVDYNGTTYYPATNRRGDVVAIYKNTGECVAKYEYDAWGNVIAVTDASGNAITSQTHIANVNPIRYRGYYYDTETKLYYLQSRYYNPEVGRFLNADGFITTDVDELLTYNMFAYCGNNPVMYSDPSGKWTLLAALGFVLTISSIICAVSDIADAIKPVTKTVRSLTKTLDTVSNGASLYSTLATTKDGFDTAAATKISHTSNVVNAGSSKKLGITTQVTIPNKKVFSNEEAYQNLCETSYSNLIAKTKIEFNRDIQGLSWNELTLNEQEKLVKTMGAWDIETAENIAYECAETVVGGIF